MRKEAQLKFSSEMLIKEKEWNQRFQEQEERFRAQQADKESLQGQIEKLNTSHEQMKSVTPPPFTTQHTVHTAYMAAQIAVHLPVLTQYSLKISDSSLDWCERLNQ